MLSKQRLSELLIFPFFLVLFVINDCKADWVVKESSTTFGRIKSLDSSKVVIMPGCSGEQAQVINWNDIDPFGGIEFNDTCDARWHSSTSGATAERSGPTATWFAVKFQDDLFLWAEQVELQTDATLKVKLVKGRGQLQGPISKVKRITRNVVHVNDNVTQPQWPVEFKRR